MIVAISVAVSDILGITIGKVTYFWCELGIQSLMYLIMLKEFCLFL